MDQLKEILRQAIKYRFWIAVGVSALLPMIAYLVGSGPIQAKAKTQADAITSAEKDVKNYTSPTVPTARYKKVVAGKTDELTEDVTRSWKKLYERQAPLLTWPETVQERFTAWGRKWPENVDASTVQNTIIDYVNAYPAFVTQVYKTFKPFDPDPAVKETGIVSAPPEEALLRPAKFTQESPPGLGKVWAAQERLWIQRTLLEVIAEVNHGAKDWDGAVVKQINALEVGNAAAQDQRSVAKGDTLEEAPEISDPSKPADSAASPADAAGAYSPGAVGMMGMGGMAAGLAGSTNAETVSYIKNEGTQFKVLPVMLSVLIGQDHIQDLLVALENSPMTIQVMDFEMSRPTARVTKPEKGQSNDFGMGGGMGMGGYGAMMAPGKMTGFGGRSMMGGAGGGYEAMMRGGGMGMGMGMMGMGGGAAEKKGVDARSKDRGKAAETALKNVTKKGAASTLHDPYYNIVEVKIYGQARFFNPPPTEAPAEPSQAAEGEAGKKAETPKAEGEAEKKDEGEARAKKDAPKAEGEAEKKDAAPKAEGEAEKKDAAPRAEGEAEKKDAPKAEGEAKEKKDAAPKADEAAKKPEAPKAEAPR